MGGLFLLWEHWSYQAVTPPEDFTGNATPALRPLRQRTCIVAGLSAQGCGPKARPHIQPGRFFSKTAKKSGTRYGLVK
jgi:hypothetical protein